ncbi:unnamed protein product [Ectocarpus sp. CCAP 1310/34]|nr:unnamed protein product [Ectocarpus sp. CCAP 1310/34]
MLKGTTLFAVAAAGLLNVAVSQEFPAMEFVIPLYIAPMFDNGTTVTIDPQWTALAETAATGATVFGILNPASGPGEVTDTSYPDVIDYVKDAGAKMLCYVATTYGNKTTDSVEEEIMAYQSLYPGACDGIFFDEAPHLLTDAVILEIYTAHNSFAHSTLDTTTEEARVVFNTGQAADEQYFSFSPPAEVLGYENYFKAVRQLGVPETSDISTPPQNMLLLHSATELAEKPELIQPFMDKAYCKGWGTVYVTDDLFDEGNPWDNPPTFWTAFIEAARNIPTVESCGDGGLKIIAPLLGSDDADTEAIMATADPGDYGDRIMVAMNVEITETGESTDRAAAVRDAGAKVLCYIEADKYGNDLATLEEVVETFTFFPLNEICGGFFFGAFNILLAIEDMPGMQSLYLKTQKTFLQPTVVFAPEVQDYSDGFESSYSFSYDFVEDDWYSTNNWDSTTNFELPWEDVMTETDLVALAESLTVGLGDGATAGEIVVAEAMDGGSIIPEAPEPNESTAALITGYAGAPEDVMFDLFTKNWAYGYVTNYDDFEFLSTQWSAVVASAYDTESFVEIV